MFTGLVERVAPIVGVKAAKGGLVLEVDLGACAEGVRQGDSICVAGACLTVISLEGTVAGFDLSPETIEKTVFSSVLVGGSVNIERSLRVGDRLGGHFVSGHVDGLGEVVAIENHEDFSTHFYRAPAEMQAFLVSKGSITVDGVSLTIAELQENGVFSVALIPETLDCTTLSELGVGDSVHLEGDLLGKYVQRILDLRT